MFVKSRSRRRAFLFSLLSGVLASASAFAEGGLESVNVIDLQEGGQVQQVTDYEPLQDGSGTKGAAQGSSSRTAEAAEAPSEPPAMEKMSPPIIPEAPYHVEEAWVPACNCVSGGHGKSVKAKKEAAAKAAKGAYKGLFFDNDFSYLDDPYYDGPSFFGDSFKGLLDGKLDIGGEVRVRYHNERNHRGLGITGNDDNFFLTRLRLFSNYRINDRLRIYGEYLFADSSGEFFNNRPIEENRGEIQNLFVEANVTDRLSVAVGRQELLLGSQRLVSPLDFANTRRTFQGVSGTYRGDDWTIDGFWTNPVVRNAANESRIDDANEEIDFYGVYGSTDKFDIGKLDLYFLGQVNDIQNANFQTLGAFLKGKGEHFLYEFEGGVQFGETNTGTDRGTGFFTGGLGRQLNIPTKSGSWKPIIWAFYDWAGGDNAFPANAGDNGFEQLQPLGHKYLGFLDLFGRRNINDVNVQFISPVFGKRVKLILWLHHFFLDEATTPFNVNGAPFANAANGIGQAGDKELGQEIDILFNINVNERTNVQIGYSYFNAGDYYQTTPNALDLDAEFFYAHYQTRF